MSTKKEKKSDFGQLAMAIQVARDQKRKREQVEPAPVVQHVVPVVALDAVIPTPVAQVALPTSVVAPVVVAPVTAPVVPPQIQRTVNSALVPSIPWSEKHRPTSIVRVIGNSKAKEFVQQWFVARQWRQPLLIAGPNGIGKTSLAHAACRDFSFMVQECNSLPGDLLVLVKELLSRKGEEQVALVLDEVHTYTPGERTELAKLLKKPLSMPVILVCDELDQSMDALKSVCKLVRMYRQVGAVGDVTTLTRTVLKAESKGLYPAQLNLIHAAACGDLRRCIIMLELACKTRRCRSTDERADLFVDSLFDAASSLLYSRPRQVSFDQGTALFKQHDLMTWMVHENYADACELESAVAVASYLSDVDMLDSHSSHHCHEHAATLACAAVMTLPRASSLPRLTFPSSLATFSRRKSLKNTLHEARLSWEDWRLLSVNFSLLQQATQLTPKELSKVVNTYALTTDGAV